MPTAAESSVSIWEPLTVGLNFWICSLRVDLVAKRASRPIRLSAAGRTSAERP